MTSYHSKHVLVTGQGPLEEIARDLGFSRVTTIEMLRETFPLHDIMDSKRRANASSANPLAKHFPPIEAVVLMGDCIRWETNMQVHKEINVFTPKPEGCEGKGGHKCW